MKLGKQSLYLCPCLSARAFLRVKGQYSALRKKKNRKKHFTDNMSPPPYKIPCIKETVEILSSLNSLTISVLCYDFLLHHVRYGTPKKHVCCVGKRKARGHLPECLRPGSMLMMQSETVAHGQQSNTLFPTPVRSREEVFFSVPYFVLTRQHQLCRVVKSNILLPLVKCLNKSK